MTFARSLLPFFVLLLVFQSSVAAAKILYVSKTGDGADGLSWPTAFTAVGEAIESASAGDEIWVASGTYNESLQMKDQVSMYGGFLGASTAENLESRNWRVYETILDASGLNNRVIEGADETVLDGFTITGGRRLFNTTDDGGSGMSCRNVTMVIRNCRFENNGRGILPGGPQPASGGGLFCIDSNLTIVGCFFLNNVATDGGAVFVTFEAVRSSVLFKNCLFDRNSGPAITAVGSDEFIINTTFGFSNGAGSDFDDIAAPGIRIVNCVIPKGMIGDSDIFFSLVPGRTGPGVVDGDPLFVDPENGDYRLQLGSPCIDTGTKVEVLIDLDGNPRPVDLVGRGHEGDTAFDMGAYEFQLLPADLDADGSVNTQDLILFQEQWQEGENERKGR